MCLVLQIWSCKCELAGGKRSHKAWMLYLMGPKLSWNNGSIYICLKWFGQGQHCGSNLLATCMYIVSSTAAKWKNMSLLLAQDLSSYAGLTRKASIHGFADHHSAGVWLVWLLGANCIVLMLRQTHLLQKIVLHLLQPQIPFTSFYRSRFL